MIPPHGARLFLSVFSLCLCGKKNVPLEKTERSHGFTLIELLVVISIIALLVSILMPSLQGAKEQAKAIQCLANLRNLGTGMAVYHGENNGIFWPYNQGGDSNGQPIYFWGSIKPADKRVDTSTSAFMAYIGGNLNFLACPNQPWGSYVPQASAKEPTTNYGYNAYYLNPDGYRTSTPGRLYRDPTTGMQKSNPAIPDPARLFVFNDSAMYWKPAGVSILQNSTYLEPVSGNAVQQPTTHFRHRGDRTHALCADGHAERFGLEGGPILVPEQKLGFVGTENNPHYAQ